MPFAIVIVLAGAREWWGIEYPPAVQWATEAVLALIAAIALARPTILSSWRPMHTRLFAAFLLILIAASAYSRIQPFSE